MPNLSMFYGIIIYMYNEVGSKHHVPHIHARFAEDELVISLDGAELEGTLPQSKKTLVLAWINIHRDELYANWDLLLKGEPAYKIEPLR